MERSGLSKRSGPSNGRQQSKVITDPRFENFQRDPRFQLPSRKHQRVPLDSRFARVLSDADFTRTAKVDRYGRRLPKASGKKDLARLYRLEDADVGESLAARGQSSRSRQNQLDAEPAADESGEDDEVVERELQRLSSEKRTYDPARDGGFSQSSSSEEDSEATSSSSEEEDVDEDEDALDGHSKEVQPDAIRMQEAEAIPSGEVTRRLAVVNLDWDNIRAVDLLALARSFAPATGQIESVCIYPSEFGKQRMQREELEGPASELFSGKDKTKNNSNARARVPVSSDRNGNDISSEDGDDDNEDEAGEDDDQIKRRLLEKQAAETEEVSSTQLRAYQLTRLRYYYAIITCSNIDTAQALYNSMDGREYLASANFFDLRFVPDEVSFDEEVARDEAKELPRGYKPNEFSTEALTHSKVRLTWDDEDANRKQAQKRAFARERERATSRGADLDDDVRVYLGSSDSEDNESEPAEQLGVLPSSIRPEAQNGDTKSTKEEESQKVSKAEAARQKLRAALGLSTDTGSKSSVAKDGHNNKDSEEKKGRGEIQITFTAGLSNSKTNKDENDLDSVTESRSKSSVFVNRPSDAIEETTMEKYIRKEKERKARRKEKHRAAREGDEKEQNEEDVQQHALEVNNDDDDDGRDPFDDPFFTNPTAAITQAKKEAKRQRHAREAAEEEAQAGAKQRERAELELLMSNGDGTRNNSGFDMAEIRRREKAAAKSGMKKSKYAKKLPVDEEDNFRMDVSDPRFAGVMEQHDFAIDPSHPRFSGTKSMRTLLDEGRRRRKEQRDSHGTKVEDSGIDSAAVSGKKRVSLAEHENGLHSQTNGTGDADDLLRLTKKLKRRKLK